MPRTKVNPDELLELEIRITPPDQTPITDWKFEEGDFKVLLAAEEGTANGKPKLHYHLYIETLRSLSWIRKWIMNISHATGESNGNAVYFTRKPHEHTIPYIVKSRNVVVRIGVTQTRLEEYYDQSAEYRKSKETERKRKQRGHNDELTDVFAEVEKDLKSGSIHPCVDSIVTRTLAICSSNAIQFPTRMCMEKNVLRLIYPYDNDAVRSYYARSFPENRYTQ